MKGIGLKTAQRIIVDLKDKIKTGAVAAASTGGTATLSANNEVMDEAVAATLPANNEVMDEAVAALTMLGFAQGPSQKVVIGVLKEEPSAPVEQVIKLALKRL